MADQPNVLLLLTDQQRADTLAPDSPCRTPNLDRIAADGVRFERCYAQNAICSPSRASLMTGTLPHTHGMVHCTHNLPQYLSDYREELPTWSERLAAAGYDLGYFGKWHVERSNDLGRFGFDEYETRRSESFDRNYRAHRRERGLPAESPYGGYGESGEGAADRFSGDPGVDPEPGLTRSYTVRQSGYRDFLLYGTHEEPAAGHADYYTYDRGIEFVETRADAADPWCLTVSTAAPHDPYVVPEEHWERYDPAAIEPPASFEDSLRDKPDVYRRQAEVWADMDWEHFAEATAAYYALTSLVDDQVGRLLDALERTGQWEDTVVVFASDHGDLLGAHRLMLKGVPAFEEAYRVPLLVRHPEGVSGETRSEIVSLFDLAPTLADLGGRDLECTADSIAPFLFDDRPDGFENEAYAEFHGQRINWSQRIVWRDDDKYVFDAFDGEDELYDLAADPAETDNLLAGSGEEHAAVAEDLAARMWERCRETGDETMANTNYPMYRYAPVGPEVAADE
jgi:arylsulfatase A-like enzyme